MRLATSAAVYACGACLILRLRGRLKNSTGSPLDFFSRFFAAQLAKAVSWLLSLATLAADTFGRLCGVIARHLDGVAFVAIQANGGKAVLIQRPTINPQTKCEEYWTTIRNPGDKPIHISSPEDRKNQRDAVWEITIRVMVIGVPMAVIAVPGG